jgi:cobyrinic acid a,c-diamide synthase
MPKHPLKAACLLFVLSAFVSLFLASATRASDKGVGLLLSVTTLFHCADRDMSKGEGTCNRAADQDSAVVGSVNVTGIACKSPADLAGIKRRDVIVSINGIAINGLSEDAYEDLIDMAAGGKASWVILRKSFGRWEKKELTLLPGELGDDFSCGKPDSET